MNILFIGDYKANTGPSNVNKNLKKYLSNEVLYLNSKNIIMKSIELIVKTFYSKVIIISGVSRINLIAIKLAKLLDKKMIYILHGCIEYENKINNLNNSGGETIEKECFESAHCILAVSENYMRWFKEYYPKYKYKTSYLNNGIEWEVLDKVRNITSIEREPNTIITMGGGRPQKNNVKICEAIKLLNNKSGNKLKLIVLGRDYEDTEKIKSYDFVDYVGQVNHDEIYIYLKKAGILIQNSTVESFGLAPIEALLSGCDILVSKNVGASCIMQSIEETDIINDCNDINEIAEKIEYLLNNTNNVRLLDGIDRDKTSCKYAANRLMRLIEELETKGKIS